MSDAATAAQLLGAVDAAIADGDGALAWGRLERLWRDHAGPASANQVLRRAEGLGPRPGQRSCSVAVLRSCTVEPLVPVLRAGAAMHRLDLTVTVGGYNTYAQELLDPGSWIYGDEPPQIVVVFGPARDLAPELWDGGPADAAAVDRVVGELERLITAFRSRSDATLLLHGLDLPPRPALGIAGAGQLQLVHEANARIAAAAAAHRGVHVVDYDAVVANEGRQRWYDERKWATMRMPFRAESMAALTGEWLRFILPVAGRTAKALICDLDNTLWGGVVGEDGVDGIAIGETSAGLGYLQLQRSIRDLLPRGVLLGMCSKNNPADVDEVFERRREMVLRREDFAASRIGWGDKAAGLTAIAEELNIGLDSLVFIDDNPMECDLVRRHVPEVTVIELDRQPDATFQPVAGHPLFERLSLTDDDRRRTDMYRQQAQRRAVEQEAGSLEEYLASLGVTVEIRELAATDVARVAQLTQKTNQFNVTTRRYTEQQIEAMGADPAWRVYVVGSTDRFGDHGTIGVVLARLGADEWDIDTLLLSCRVIGRGVETAMLAAVAGDAEKAGAVAVTGTFVPTAKNAPAQRLFLDHGFAELPDGDGGGSRWRRPASPLHAPDWILMNDRTEEDAP